MAFITYCNNKGCMKEQTPLLNTETNQVICAECGKEITTLTVFAKNQMKSLGQTTKLKKSKETYSVKCQACNLDSRPILDENNVLACSKCKKSLTGISAPFEGMLRKLLFGQK